MKNIIIAGMKNSGKTTLAKLIAKNQNIDFISVDDLWVRLYNSRFNENLSMREIAKKHGTAYFRKLESEVVEDLKKNKISNSVIDLGGGTLLNENNRNILKSIGKCVYVNLEKEINYKRIIQNGIPAFFKYQNDPRKSFEELLTTREPIYKNFADYTIDITNESPEEVYKKFIILNIL